MRALAVTANRPLRETSALVYKGLPARRLWARRGFVSDEDSTRASKAAPEPIRAQVVTALFSRALHSAHSGAPRTKSRRSMTPSMRDLALTASRLFASSSPRALFNQGRSRSVCSGAVTKPSPSMMPSTRALVGDSDPAVRAQVVSALLGKGAHARCARARRGSDRRL